MNREELRNQFQADLRKFRGSTIERKQMSTKTTFKRIALVAVAALGLGVLSVAPSSAALTGVTITTSNGTATLQSTTSGKANADTTTAAFVTVNALFGAYATDTLTVEAFEKTIPAGATSGKTLLGYYDTTTISAPRLFGKNLTPADSGTVGSKIYLDTASANGYSGQKFWIQLDTSVATQIAGTYTYTVLVKQYSIGTVPGSATAPVTTTADVSIVVSAPATEAETPSAAYSATWLGTTGNPTSDSTTINAVATAGTAAVGKLNVQIRNSVNTAFAVDTVTIVITGPGLLLNGSAYTKYAKVIGQTGDVSYSIVPDGTSGVSSIKVSYEVTGQVFTKTMNFYSAAAKSLTASVFNPALAVGANTTAVAVAATDSNGNAWTGTAYIVASAAADALVAGSATTPVQCAAWNSTTGILCPVTALTVGTAKFKVIDASTVAAATATSNEVTVTVSQQVVASVKLAFDKSSYAPNEKATITVTPLDAAGKAVQGKAWTALLATGGITSTSAFAAGSDTLTATALTTSAYSSSSLNAGSYTYTVYMPAASGDVTISATGGTDVAAAGQIKVSATAAVVNASVDAATDAANEATDAANAATDAALAAADAADAATAAAQDASDAVAALSATVAKLVASLKAQITSLTNLVIKIQKKVRA